MNTVRRGKRQVKGEEPKRVTLADFALHAPVDTLVELIQALIPLGLMAVGDCLKADVARGGGALPSWGTCGVSEARCIWPELPIHLLKSPHRPGGAAGDVHALAEAARGRCRTFPPGAEGAELSGL